MLKRSLISTGSRVLATGIVWPALIVCLDVPFSSSRYFRPIAETDSNHSSSLAEADALIIQPEDSPGIAAGFSLELGDAAPTSAGSVLATIAACAKASS